MSYESQKTHFDEAYRTGSDIWSAYDFSLAEKKFAEHLAQNALVLDIGAGRGRFTYRLAESGFRVIALEYLGNVIEKNNDEARVRGFESKVKFFEGDALDIPFTDASFDGASDVGLYHHLLPVDQATYAREVARVVKQGGTFLLVTLSKETSKYLSWNPKASSESDFEYQGAHYHFATESELETVFGADFTVISSSIEHMLNDAHIAYHVMLFKRK